MLIIPQVGVVRASDLFLHFGDQAISLERMKLDISNLVCRLNANAKSTGITHVKVLQNFKRSRDLKVT